MSYFWPLPPVTSMTFDDKFFDQMFPPQFFGALADMMTVDLTRITITALRQGFFDAFLAYCEGKYDLANFRPLKEENTKLERVQKDAYRLMISLSDLFECGRTQKKLQHEVKTNPTHFTTSTGLKLADLLQNGMHDNPFIDFRELLSDLSISAGRAQINEPKLPKMDASKLSSEDEIDAFIASMMSFEIMTGGKNAMARKEWEKRKANHKLGADHPLLEFVRTFKPTWESLSPVAFTQGHYYEKIGHAPSPLVASLEMIFGQIDTTVTPQNIVTTIRKIISQQ